jgi:hypothetical protein
MTVMLNELLADYDRLNYILGPREGCGEMIDGLREELGLPEGTKRPQIVWALISRINWLKKEIGRLGGFPEGWEPTYGLPRTFEGCQDEMVKFLYRFLKDKVDDDMFIDLALGANSLLEWTWQLASGEVPSR